MSKKYEFQPDKPRSTWLSKLYLTRLQRLALLKWVLYALCLIILSVVQDVILCRFRFHGATTELVPIGIFLICLIEGTQQGSLFSLIASLLYFFSGSSPGAHSMVLITVLSIVICAMRQGYLQKGFAAAMLCTVLFMVLYEAAIFAVALFLKVTILERFVGFAITTGLSLISAPILYPIFVSIGSIGGDAWKE